MSDIDDPSTGSDTPDDAASDDAAPVDAAPVEKAPVEEAELVPQATVSEADRVAERKQVRKERIALLVRSPSFIIGILIIFGWIFCGLFPDVVARYDPQDSIRIVEDGVEVLIPARDAPSADAWFGTDNIGRDVFSRTLVGARSVLTVAPLAAVLAVIAGTMLGLIMGYYRGWIDEVLSRIIEGFLSIPVLLIALLALTVLGRSRAVIIITVAVLFTPVVTRTVRSAVLAEAQLDYVTSAKLRGERGLYIMVREILPNIMGTIVVELTVRLGYAIFTVATLAFLGFSAGDISVPDWGTDINQTYVLVQSDQWWPTLFPAMAIAVLVIGVNLVADSLERVLNA